MAHNLNIEIPARFAFRPFRAKWEVRTIDLVGWANHRKTRERESLKEKWGSLPSLGNPLAVSVSDPFVEDVEARIHHLPFHVDLGSTWDSRSFNVDLDRESIPADVLAKHESPENTRTLEGRSFQVFICHRPELVKWSDVPGADGAEANPWKMRDALFALRPNDAYGLLRFLNRWGMWGRSRGYRHGFTYGSANPNFFLVFPHQFWQHREEYLKAVTGSPRSWLTKAAPLTFSHTEKPPFFLIERSYCREAIEATITIQHLENVRFGICKRYDCRRLYERKTKQKRLYCTPECAHLANVRKLRAKKKADSELGRSTSNAKG